MRLTVEQHDFLRILGHRLEPVLDIDAGGLTHSKLKEIDRALTDHELVKVRVPYGDRARRQRLLEELAPLSQAHLVERASNTAVLYRPSTRSVIRIPAPQSH
jgi:RNA-binding protein